MWQMSKPTLQSYTPRHWCVVRRWEHMSNSVREWCSDLFLAWKSIGEWILAKVRCRGGCQLVFLHQFDQQGVGQCQTEISSLTPHLASNQPHRIWHASCAVICRTVRCSMRLVLSRCPSIAKTWSTCFCRPRRRLTTAPSSNWHVAANKSQHVRELHAHVITLTNCGGSGLGWIAFVVWSSDICISSKLLQKSNAHRHWR